MNDALEVSMLHGTTDRQEQVQARSSVETVLVAEFGDGQSFDQLQTLTGQSG